MKINIILVAAISTAIGILAGIFISDTGAMKFSSKVALTVKEPLLIAGEQKHYSILPAGTVLYFDRDWPEGHLTYHVYFDIKGEIKSEPADASMMAPLWLRPPRYTQLLSAPISRNVRIVSAAT